jgi:hypothetical protein
MHKVPHTPNNNAFLSTKKEGEQLISIGATHAEIIILQAALHHYRDYISYDKDLQAKTAPLIQRFIQRLHDQLPLRKDQI